MLPWMDTVAQTTATVAQRTQGQAEHWVPRRTASRRCPRCRNRLVSPAIPASGPPRRWTGFRGSPPTRRRPSCVNKTPPNKPVKRCGFISPAPTATLSSTPTFTEPQALDGSVGSLPLTSPRIDAASAPPAIAIAGGGTPAHLIAAHQPAPINRQLHRGHHQLPTNRRPRSPNSPTPRPPPPRATSRHRRIKWPADVGHDVGRLAHPHWARRGRASTFSIRARIGTRGSAGGTAGPHRIRSPAQHGLRPPPHRQRPPALDEMSTARGSAGPAAATATAARPVTGNPSGAQAISKANGTANIAANTSSTRTRTRSSETCHPPRHR